MKIFNKATIKLTLLYTTVLMLISICFSVAIGVTASREMNRPFERQPMNRIFPNDDGRIMFEKTWRERTEESHDRLVIALILTNVGVLFLGAGLSFFLARWTLRPIERAMESKTRFVANASHELRTPLAVMLMENEVLLRDKSVKSGELREQIKSNLVEIEKLQKLTDYLLQIDKDEDFDLSDINIEDVVVEAVQKFSSVAGAKNIQLDIKTQPKIIKSNFDALARILDILLENAIKYSGENSTIHIIATDSQIAVIDQGIGISSEDLPHIFERFYRAEKSRTSDGYGLGLSIAKNLANQLHIQVVAENNADGCGATFRIVF
ncbi:MAG: HAMP domain-containing histidine kinase [Candidatus Nomurabacteria bacterium]|jgi:signal transduction histidine kinase|nr:HAMP domain-containing histidine kinase [Candidatus Nomurabacteria bacterium]